MVWPTAGSQVNVPDPEPDGPDEAEPDDDPGTTTVYDPASPSVPFSCVCSVSDPRVTPTQRGRDHHDHRQGQDPAPAPPPVPGDRLPARHRSARRVPAPPGRQRLPCRLLRPAEPRLLTRRRLARLLTCIGTAHRLSPFMGRPVRPVRLLILWPVTRWVARARRRSSPRTGTAATSYRRPSAPRRRRRSDSDLASSGTHATACIPQP